MGNQQQTDNKKISKQAYQAAVAAGKEAVKKNKSRSVGDKLFSFFGIRVAPKTPNDNSYSSKTQTSMMYGIGNSRDLETLQDFRDPRSGNIRRGPHKMSGELGKLFDAYLSDTYVSTEMLKEKEERYANLDYMYENEPFISQTADTLAEEAAQIDQQEHLISVEASSKEQQEDMYRLLNMWGIDQRKVIDTLFNIGYYGDGLWGLKTSPQGVLGVKPMHPELLKERIEFNPIREKQRLLDLGKSWESQKTKDAKINALIDMIQSEDFEDLSDIFDTYLFGFDIGGLLTPPWNAYHFRLNANRSRYFPYGQSSFLKALAPFNQMSSTFVLQALARVMSFPVREMSVATTGTMTEADHFEKLNKVRELYEGQGYEMPDITSDPYSLLSTVWNSEGLMNLKIHSSPVDMDFVGDLEILTDRVAIASGSPKGWLVQEWGGWGNSGVALVEQHKPFARRAYALQSSFQEGLGDIFRLHYAITGDYDPNEPFKLTMNFPSTEMDSERTSIKKESLTLAADVLSSIGDAMGVDGPLPFEVAKDVLIKMAFVADKDIEKWMNIVRKHNPDAYLPEDEEEDITSGDADDFFENTDLKNYLKKSVRIYEREVHGPGKAKRIYEQYLKIREGVILKAHIKFHIKEGQAGNRHYTIQGGAPEGYDPLKIMMECVKAKEDTKRLRG